MQIIELGLADSFAAVLPGSVGGSFLRRDTGLCVYVDTGHETVEKSGRIAVFIDREGNAAIDRDSLIILVKNVDISGITGISHSEPQLSCGSIAADDIFKLLDNGQRIVLTVALPSICLTRSVP